MLGLSLVKENIHVFHNLLSGQIYKLQIAPSNAPEFTTENGKCKHNLNITNPPLNGYLTNVK